jgi:hypothetical protein
MAKQMIAMAGSRENPITMRVKLNNVDEKAQLDPTLARSAARVAFGHTLGVTVSDGKTTYRLSRSGAKKIKYEQ